MVSKGGRPNLFEFAKRNVKYIHGEKKKYI
jgi:hypothetical protein